MSTVINYRDFAEVASLKSVSIRDACILEAKFGLISFDLSSYAPCRIVLTCKRIGGNGIFSLVYGSNVDVLSVVSKASQRFEIDSEDGRFVFSRPFNSIGEIGLLDIEILREEEGDMIKWRHLLSRATEHAGLKDISGNLYASEGAFVRAGVIYKVETKPANMYRLEGPDYVKFIGKCQIVNLEFAQGKPNKLKIPGAEKIVLENKLQPRVQESTLPLSPVYCKSDSYVERGFIHLGPSGLYSIPISGIEDAEYVIGLTVQVVEGNGKLQVKLGSSEATIAANGQNAYTTILKGEASSLSNLEISRPTGATGSLNITAILFKRGNSLQKNVVTTKFVPPKMAGLKLLSSNYRDSYKNFAIFKAEEADRFDDIELNLIPKTYSMHNWIAKWKNMFPNVSIDSVQFDNVAESKSENSILLTDIDNLFYHPRIFVEEFSKPLSAEGKSLLASCNFVASPSLMTVQYLRTFCKNVVYVPKYWPHYSVEATVHNKPLVFCRDEYIGSYLKDNLIGDVLFVGDRGLTKNSIGDSLSYKELLSYIAGASVIVDISSNIHYFSGLLDYSLIAKKNIITNNYWMSVCKPSVKLVDNVFAGDKLIPNIDQLNNYLNRGFLPSYNGNMSSYNYNLLSTLRMLKESI